MKGNFTRCGSDCGEIKDGFTMERIAVRTINLEAQLETEWSLNSNESKLQIGRITVEADFWLERWKTNEIGFHANKANHFLVKYFGEVGVGKGARVFVPLCGKSLDLHWLLAQGYRVAGAELSRIAVELLFEELGVKPRLTEMGELTRYSADEIEIYLGDIFNLTREVLGKVDAIYDRAALVALPEEMRVKYTKHLMEITECAPQLMIDFVYDQSLRQGPPFSVSDAAVLAYYADAYELVFLEGENLKLGPNAEVPAVEKAWILKK